MYRNFGKRLIDLVIAIVASLLLAPVVLVVALLTRIWLGSPILFRQPRAGSHGRVFVLNKFRSMTDARDQQGDLLGDEHRLTRFGKFLRASSLDELPQLWNVIRGDMSLVGPRPLLVEYLPRYNETQMRRHEVRPGITGWAQVNGRNAISWPERFELDVYYVDHLSFRLDLKILLMTVVRVFKRSGISQSEHATMPRFTGNETVSGLAESPSGESNA